MDEPLHNRSALEFVRDRLNDAQRAELDTVDILWRARPKAFNQCFAAEHNRRRKARLTGFVEDETGKTPTIPRCCGWTANFEQL